jgi:hypothetical protein
MGRVPSWFGAVGGDQIQCLQGGRETVQFPVDLALRYWRAVAVSPSGVHPGIGPRGEQGHGLGAVVSQRGEGDLGDPGAKPVGKSMSTAAG